MIELKPVKSSKIITREDNLVNCITESLDWNNLCLRDKDILVVAETVVGTTEGRQVNLESIIPSEMASQIANQYSLDSRLAQLVIENSDLILGGLPGVLLTVVNNNLIANAGIDKSNSGGGSYVTLWPQHPYRSAQSIRHDLLRHYSLSDLGIVISDSHVAPMRQGVIGSAIGVAGFRPVQDCKGRKDLFGYEMSYTKRAIADQVVTAAHLCMGECDEQTPFVIVCGVETEFTNETLSHEEIYMPLDKCLFMNSFKDYIKKITPTRT